MLVNTLQQWIKTWSELTFFMPMFPSYRNQSIDLQWKSIDWFLYEGNIGMKNIKHQSITVMSQQYFEGSKFDRVLFLFIFDVQLGNRHCSYC